MESSSYSSSSSTSSSQFSSYITYPQEVKRSKQSSLRSSLHAVRKHPAKMMKKPIAPLPPTPPKIYNVEAGNFMEMVQKLTGSPEYQIRRLQDGAPPPLGLAPMTFPNDNIAVQQAQPLRAANHRETYANVNDLMMQTATKNSRKVSDTFGAFSPLGFTFSPSSQGWLSSLMLSPGTQSYMDASTIL